MVSDLRSLRQAWALTLEQAAVGIMHPITLSRVERGLNRPHPNTVRALAKRYRVNTRDIMDRWLVTYENMLALRMTSPMAAVPAAASASTLASASAPTAVAPLAAASAASSAAPARDGSVA